MSLTFCFADRKLNTDTTRNMVWERNSCTTSSQFQLGNINQLQACMCMCMFDDVHCQSPPSGLASVFLNVLLSSTVGNPDVSLSLLRHKTRDLAPARRVNQSHIPSNLPEVYQNPQSDSSQQSDHTFTPQRLLRTEATKAVALSGNIGCGNSPLATFGSTWSCICSLDLILVYLFNPKVKKETQLQCVNWYQTLIYQANTGGNPQEITGQIISFPKFQNFLFFSV